MRTVIRGLMFFLRLACVVSEVVSLDKVACDEILIAFESRYPSGKGSVSNVDLDGTFYMFRVEEGIVEYVHPELSVSEMTAETGFLSYQRDVLLDFRRQRPNVTNLRLQYLCLLDAKLSCDVVCEFDDYIMQVTDGQLRKWNVENEELGKLCEAKYDFSLLEPGWSGVRRRWSGLCEYLRRPSAVEVTISFRYRPKRRSAVCVVSVSDHVYCRVRIYRDREVLARGECQMSANGTVSAVVSYETRDSGPLQRSRCFVYSDFFADASAPLEVDVMADDSPTTAVGLESVADSPEDRVDGRTNIGLIAGLTCVGAIALAVRGGR